jgi:hypothetical protein
MFQRLQPGPQFTTETRVSSKKPSDVDSMPKDEHGTTRLEQGNRNVNAFCNL